MMNVMGLHVDTTAAVSTPWGRKKGINSSVCIFFRTWQKLVIFFHLRWAQGYKLQFRLFNFGMREEFCSDIKHFMFASPVMKLMITG